MNSDKDIKNLLQEVISSTVFEATAIIETTTQLDITEILTQIRAIKGVVIVNLKEASEKVTENKKRAVLKIKFLPIGGSLKGYVKFMTSSVRATNGVLAFRTKEIVDVERRSKQEREKKSRMKKIKSF
jgi:hypothetical protein